MVRTTMDLKTMCIVSLLVFSDNFTNSINYSWIGNGAFPISNVLVIFSFGINSIITPLLPYTFLLSWKISYCHSPYFLFSCFTTLVEETPSYIHCSISWGSLCALNRSPKGKSNSLVINSSCLPSSACILSFVSLLFVFIIFTH